MADALDRLPERIIAALSNLRIKGHDTTRHYPIVALAIADKDVLDAQMGGPVWSFRGFDISITAGPSRVRCTCPYCGGATEKLADVDEQKLAALAPRAG